MREKEKSLFLSLTQPIMRYHHHPSIQNLGNLFYDRWTFLGGKAYSCTAENAQGVATQVGDSTCIAYSIPDGQAGTIRECLDAMIITIYSMYLRKLNNVQSGFFFLFFSCFFF